MKNRKTATILLSTLIFNISSFAQCAMCKAAVSSNLEDGGDVGSGINTGIFYLMAIPYILLSFGAYFFFKKQVDAKLKEWKNKFFAAKQTHL